VQTLLHVVVILTVVVMGVAASPTNFSNGRGFSSNSHKTYHGRRQFTYTPSRGVFHSRSMPVRLVCQVCNKQGHIALDCYNRSNDSYSCVSQGQPYAYYSSSSSGQDYNWYPDSGATHHLTSDINNLNLKSDDYIGSNQIKIGKGTGLPIHHIGHTRFFTPPYHFDLFNVLHVPYISKNLLSVHLFTKDTNTFFEFYPYYFLLKDRRSKRVLLCSPNRQGLYQFPFPANKSPPSTLVGECVSLPQRHSRLGHPAFKVVRSVLSSFNLPVKSNKNSISCHACLSSKAKQLPFLSSMSQATRPLELIFTDVWGLAPACSRSGSKYYVSFLDSFSRYTWLYPI
jgi:hypothetical protein